MKTADKFLIGTMMLLVGVIGLTSIKTIWTMVIGVGIALMMIA